MLGIVLSNVLGPAYLILVFGVSMTLAAAVLVGLHGRWPPTRRQLLAAVAYAMAIPISLILSFVLSKVLVDSFFVGSASYRRSPSLGLGGAQLLFYGVSITLAAAVLFLHRAAAGVDSRSGWGSARLPRRQAWIYSSSLLR